MFTLYQEAVNIVVDSYFCCVLVVLDANRWFHATKITGDDISIVIGSEYD